MYKHYAKVLHAHDDTFQVHAKILEWGKAIKHDFDASNIPFTLGHTKPDPAQVAQAFSLLNTLMRDALAAQGHMIAQQGDKIGELHGVVSGQQQQLSQLHSMLSGQQEQISQIHALLFSQMHSSQTRDAQAGAQTASSVAGPSQVAAVADAQHDADIASSYIYNIMAEDQDAVQRKRSATDAGGSSSGKKHGLNDSSKALSMTGLKDSAPGFDQCDSLIDVYKTWLRHKWTRPSDAGTWKDKRHKSMGAKVFSWVNPILTEEEREILEKGEDTDHRGFNDPNVGKVEHNLQKLIIGIVYQIHKDLGLEVPKGLNYRGQKFSWAHAIPIKKTTLINHLDQIKGNLSRKHGPRHDKVTQYIKSAFIAPPPEVVTKLREEWSRGANKLQAYTSKRSREDEDGPAGGSASRRT